MSLEKHVADYERGGCRQAELGIQKMPAGYALMIDHDDLYYFWLRHDGTESSIHWNKWAIRRGAIRHAALNTTEG